MLYLVGLLVFLIIATAVLALLQRWLKPHAAAGSSADLNTPLPFRRKDYLLSVAEKSFYEALKGAIEKRYVIFAKVRLLDLLWLPQGTRGAQGLRNRVQSKHVDFVLCDPKALRPLLVIELDDASHQRADRIQRDMLVDQVLTGAGLPIHHEDVKSSYDVGELTRMIQEKITPA